MNSRELLGVIPAIFDFGDDDGFWESVILPELQQDRRREDILTLVEARSIGATKPDVMGKKKKPAERTGGSGEGERIPPFGNLDGGGAYPHSGRTNGRSR